MSDTHVKSALDSIHNLAPNNREPHHLLNLEISNQIYSLFPKHEKHSVLLLDPPLISAISHLSLQ